MLLTSDRYLIGVDPFRWDHVWHPTEHDKFPFRLMQMRVVELTQQGAVANVGYPGGVVVVSPVVGVVGFAPCWGFVAVPPHAADIPCGDGTGNPQCNPN